MDVVMESANHGGGGERRRMIKPEYAYLHVMMRFEAAVVQMDARLYKLACLEAVRAVFGETGFAAEVDVLNVREDGSAFLRVPSIAMQDFWSALSLLSTFDGKTCMFEVHQVSSSLLALVGSAPTGPDWSEFYIPD